jgi:hypothetical protein
MSAEDVPQPIMIKTPQGQEVPEVEEVLGDKYALIYKKKYDTKTNRFTLSFKIDHCRDEELKKKILELDNKKEVLYDDFYFKRLDWEYNGRKGTTVLKQTREEHDTQPRFSSSSSFKKDWRKAVDLKLIPLKVEDPDHPSDHPYTMSTVKEALTSGYELFGSNTNDAIKIFGDYLIVGLVRKE